MQDYPLSAHADEAKEKTGGDEASGAGSRSGGRGAHEVQRRTLRQASKLSLLIGPVKGLISHSPDIRTAAKTGAPRWKPCVPRRRSACLLRLAGFREPPAARCTVDTTKNSDIDSKPDARDRWRAGLQRAPTASGATPATGTPAAGTDAKKAAQIAPPTNYQTLNLKQKQKKPKKMKQREERSEFDRASAPQALLRSPVATPGSTPATPAAADTTAPKTDPPK